MHTNPASPAPRTNDGRSIVRVAGPDQVMELARAMLAGGCALPPGAGSCSSSAPQYGGNGEGILFQKLAPRDPSGMPYGPNAIQNGCCGAWPGGPRPVRATYIAGTFPAFLIGAVAPQFYNVVTQNNNFLGFKYMAPDALMGVGLGLSNIRINGFDYLDVVVPVPLEVFNALSDNETQGRIDLAWLQTPNGFAQIGVTPVASGTTAATTAQLTCFQGFASAA